MKKALIALLSLTLLGTCSTKKTPLTSVTLISDDPASQHPEWELSKDTITKEVNIGFQDFEIPAKASWVTAKDTTGCSRIGYFRLVRMGTNEDIKTDNFSTDVIPCGSKWDSEDERRFEVMVIMGEVSTRKGIKEYNFKGSIGQINGIGEYKPLNRDDSALVTTH